MESFGQLHFPPQQSEGGGMKDNLIVRFAIPQNLLLSLTCPVMYSCNSIMEEKSWEKKLSPSDFTSYLPLSGLFSPCPCPCFDFTLPKQCSLPLLVVLTIVTMLLAKTHILLAGSGSGQNCIFANRLLCGGRNGHMLRGKG